MTRGLFTLSLCLGAGRMAHAQDPLMIVSNVARGKPATQSSTDGAAAASRAVDGVTNGNLSAGNSVTHTLSTAKPWWQVDLQSVQDIGTVRIYNRTDCCAERLANFVVWYSTDGTNWENTQYPGVAGALTEIPVNRAARYVKIQLNGTGVLSLAEVQITPLRNVAKNKPATQSSTDAGSAAARAVDGNTDGNNAKSSLSHTLESPQPWWQVDTGTVQHLGQVILHNRTDCCAERLADFTLAVSNDGTHWVSYPFAGPVARQKSFLLNHLGRYVKVQKNGTGILSLAEVQVTSVTNMAKGMPATQSSGQAGTAARAVDGNVNGDFAAGSVTHTDESLRPWWQVDLKTPQMVGTVVLHNRLDCCSNRLTNFKVMVSENGTTWQEYVHAGTAGSQTYIPVNALARYVKVQLNGTGILSLAEVEVFNLP